MKRRTIIKSAIALPLTSSMLISCVGKESSKEEKKKLKILILGGTSFLGPHQVSEAISRGHSITTFTRGKTKPKIHADLFDQVDMLIGDREDNLEALKGKKWDVVIDNSGRKVEWTKATASLLKDNVGLYIYTSSTGVYYPYKGDDIKENSELNLETPHDLEFEWERMEYDYGVMKANSEIAAKDNFGLENTLLIRPTYMIGPGDNTDRFIYWPIRLPRGGDILVPGSEDDPVQFIDVRDVAKFMIDCTESGKPGVYNAVGPAEYQNMRTFVSKAAETFDVESNMVYIDDHIFLEENGISYLVPWIPPVGTNYGSSRISNEAAKNNGLQFRSIKETVKDTHEWWNSDVISQEKRDDYEQDPKGLLNTEKSIIEKWKKR